jgi:hypothetical protein
MDVRFALVLTALFSAVPALAEIAKETNDEKPQESFFEGIFLPTADEIKQIVGAHPSSADSANVDRKPAVLGPATAEPVTYSATSNDPEDQPVDPNLSNK